MALGPYVVVMTTNLLGFKTAFGKSITTGVFIAVNNLYIINLQDVLFSGTLLSYFGSKWMSRRNLNNALQGNSLSIPYWNQKADVLNLQALNYEKTDSGTNALSVFNPSLANDSSAYADGVILAPTAKID